MKNFHVYPFKAELPETILIGQRPYYCYAPSYTRT